MMERYLAPNPEAGKRFYQDFQNKGKVTMLNLLKFKSIADYTHLEALRPDHPITGGEAYQMYLDKTMPELKKAGSRILYFGKARGFLIGPETEKWDAVLLVEHQSVAKFMEFAQNQDYLKNVGHRTAALVDSRLLPTTEIKN